MLFRKLTLNGKACHSVHHSCLYGIFDDDECLLISQCWLVSQTEERCDKMLKREHCSNTPTCMFGSISSSVTKDQKNEERSIRLFIPRTISVTKDGFVMIAFCPYSFPIFWWMLWAYLTSRCLLGSKENLSAYFLCWERILTTNFLFSLFSLSYTNFAIAYLFVFAHKFHSKLEKQAKYSANYSEYLQPCSCH